MLPSFLTALLASLAGGMALLQTSEEAPEDGLTGFTGWAADIIVEFGELGVGVLTFIETVFPPIPSEIVLSLSGYLAERGRMNVALVIIAATAGAVLGALVLYGMGAWLGERRAKVLMAKIPLVEMDDLDKASDWFRRYGSGVVFFGRFVPLVRSLVSLPAGAQHMPLVPFLIYTTAGSALWNTALVGAGYALGTQYERIEDYTGYLDYALLAGVALFLIWFLVPKIRSRRAAARG